jgi:hypothetical protein
VTTYHTTRPDPPATVTIDIRSLIYGWLPVRLLAVRGGWVVVDDGEGPLWVPIDQVHLRHLPVVAAFEPLRERRN